MGAMLGATLDLHRPSPDVSDAARGRPLHVLSMTTLFPSSVSPRHGIFVETRLRELRERAPVDLKVIAPVPWFPFAWRGAGRYATYAATPRFEVRDGVDVRHPRFVVIPRVGMLLQPASLANACRRAERQLTEAGWQCDVIDAHYLYPDSVAAAELARDLRVPLVVTARGSDVNLIAQMPAPRRRILAALEHAQRVIAVSGALKRELVRLGVAGEKIEVLRNGVDTSLFRCTDRERMRGELAAGSAPLVASVGNLVPEKGHDLVLGAVARLPSVVAVIVGQGPGRANLMRQAEQLGIAQRVRWLENMPQADLAFLYGAADVLALGSTREGWPNVLLEAMACGTPVVASDVGGVREIVTDNVGEIVATRDAQVFAGAIARVLERRLPRADVRAHAETFSWDPVARRYFEILAQAAYAREPSPAAATREATR